jgi:hypothetical protein
MPSNERAYTLIGTETVEYIKYVSEMELGAMVYIQSFINNGSGIQKLKEGGGEHRQHGHLISLLYFSK